MLNRPRCKTLGAGITPEASVLMSERPHYEKRRMSERTANRCCRIVVGVTAFLLIFIGNVMGVAAGATPGSPQSSDGGALNVTVVTQRVSVTAHGAALADVLTAIGERARLRVVLDGDLTAPVTQRLDNVPIDEAVRRLTRGHSLVLVYSGGADPANGVALTEIWVSSSLPAPASNGMQRRDESANRRASNAGLAADTRQVKDHPLQLTRMLKYGAAPETRMHIVEDLVRERGEYAVLDILRDAATRDPDSRIRREAIQGLALMAIPDAVEVIRSTLRDPHPLVRFEARKALGERR